MGNLLTDEQRSRNMRAIKSQSALENMVSKALWKNGIRFRKNNKDLFGKPDISIKKYKIVIFIDSCFWHVCPIHGNWPKTNKEFWEEKLKKNVIRDIEVTKFYRKNGWHIIRVWEHDLKEDFNKKINELITFITEVKSNSAN